MERETSKGEQGPDLTELRQILGETKGQIFQIPLEAVLNLLRIERNDFLRNETILP